MSDILKNMKPEISIRFDPADPRTARGVPWEPIEIYIEPGRYNIASWFWETPGSPYPFVVNWANDAPVDQCALVWAKIAEITGCAIGDIHNLDSTR